MECWNLNSGLLSIYHSDSFLTNDCLACFVLFVCDYGGFLQELGITSDEALSLEEFPKRAVILGAGCVFFFISRVSQ
jgi:hypothetical protein